jgi:hypothetical protein
MRVAVLGQGTGARLRTACRDRRVWTLARGWGLAAADELGISVGA